MQTKKPLTAERQAKHNKGHIHKPNHQVKTTILDILHKKTAILVHQTRQQKLFYQIINLLALEYNW